MRKRRNLIIALLLVVAMVAGIGYAALARELPVNGTATLSGGSVLNVVFTAANPVSATINGQDVAVPVPDSVATAGYTGTAATYNITGLSYAGDKAVFTYTITNQSDAVAMLVGVTSVDGTCKVGKDESNMSVAGTNYFSSSVQISDGLGGWTPVTFGSNPGISLQPNDTLDVEITVKLNKTVGTDADGADAVVTLADAAVKFAFTSDAVAP